MEGESNETQPTTEETNEDVITEVQEADNILAESKKVRDELRQILKEKKELILREERLRAAEMLAGKSEAGLPTSKPVEETPQEYAKRIVGSKK